MDVREKLVELQLQADIADNVSENTTQHREFIADFMMANGVTVQEWISVKDRLPTEEDANEGGFVLANTEEKVIIALWSDVCRFNEFVTHWMPLPQPPKGE